MSLTSPIAFYNLQFPFHQPDKINAVVRTTAEVRPSIRSHVYKTDYPSVTDSFNEQAFL